MAFIEKKDPVVLNIKLTSCGRELLSTGGLIFKSFAIGDSEIDYGFNLETQHNPYYSRILRPVDVNPNIISFIPESISGDPFNVIPSMPSYSYIVTNTTVPVGFFNSGATTFNVVGNQIK